MSYSPDRGEGSPFSLPSGNETSTELDVAQLDFETHRRLLDHTWATMEGKLDSGDLDGVLDFGRQASGVFFRYWRAKFQQFALASGVTGEVDYPQLLGKTVQIGEEKLTFSLPPNIQYGVELERKTPNGEDSVHLTRISPQSWEFRPEMTVNASIGKPLPRTYNIYPLNYYLRITEGGANGLERRREFRDIEKGLSASESRHLGVRIDRPAVDRLPGQ